MTIDKDPKQKTSIVIDKDLWTKWIQFVAERTGSARKLSDELEQAIRFYMVNVPKSHKARRSGYR